METIDEIYTAPYEAPKVAYESPGPQNTENNPQGSDTKFRNEFNFTQRGGGIRIGNTTDNEKMVFTHHSGSYISWEREQSNRLAIGDDRLTVQGDSYYTFEGRTQLRTCKAWDHIVYGNCHRKVGNVQQWKQHMDAILEKYRPCHDLDRCFEIQRTGVNNPIDQSPGQTQSGAFADCPYCTREGRPRILRMATKKIDQLEDSEETEKAPGFYTEQQLLFPEIPEEKYIDEYTPLEAEAIENNPKAVKRLVPGEYFSEPLENPVPGQMFGLPCWVCGGTGKSPSTQDGVWVPDPIKQTIPEMAAKVAIETAPLENEMGDVWCRDGGNSIDIISKHRADIVGLTFNDLKPYRVDPVGKMVPYGLIVTPGGVHPHYTPSPLVEAVAVPGLPGGDYDLTVNNKFNVIVGGGGLSMRTVGNLDMSGHIATFATEQLILHGKSEVIIGSHDRIDLQAKTITLRPVPTTAPEGAGGVDGAAQVTQQVGIFGGLSVSDNLIVKGGVHCEGELTVNHITAPAQWNKTNVEDRITYGSILPGVVVGKTERIQVSISEDEEGNQTATVEPLDVITVEVPDAVEINPHVHWHLGPAVRLTGDYDDLRYAATANNNIGPVMAAPVRSVVNSDFELFSTSNNEDVGRQQPLESINAEPRLQSIAPIANTLDEFTNAITEGAASQISKALGDAGVAAPSSYTAQDGTTVNPVQAAAAAAVGQISNTIKATMSSLVAAAQIGVPQSDLGAFVTQSIKGAALGAIGGVVDGIVSSLFAPGTLLDKIANLKNLFTGIFNGIVNDIISILTPSIDGLKLIVDPIIEGLAPGLGEGTPAADNQRDQTAAGKLNELATIEKAIVQKKREVTAPEPPPSPQGQLVECYDLDRENLLAQVRMKTSRAKEAQRLLDTCA